MGLPWWHQKNAFCYNSRLTLHEFKCVIGDYCKGTTATQSSAEFKRDLDKTISRQTIANYYDGISRCVLDFRGTYPWWPVEHWSELTEEHLNDIRNIVYNHDRIINNFRKEIQLISGKSKAVDDEVYFKILREMSLKMNGLPKNSFITYLARACELALCIEAGYKDPVAVMNDNIIRIFKYEGGIIFYRKDSPVTRAEDKERIQERKKDYDWMMLQTGSIYDRTTDKEDLELELKLKAWREWYSLSEDERKKLNRQEYLSLFDDELDIPYEDRYLCE